MTAKESDNCGLQGLEKQASNAKFVDEQVNGTIPVDDGSSPLSIPTMASVFSKTLLAFGWLSVLAVALMNYLDSVAIGTFQVYALSDFNRLTMQGALATVISVATIVVQAPIAKIMNHVSYLNIFVISTAVSTLGSVLEAVAPETGLFVFGYILNVMGGIATRLIMFATATSLSKPQYRGLALASVNLPSIVSYLAGAQIAQSTLGNLGWRWGYGIWSILIPVISPCLIVTLFLYKRKSQQHRGGNLKFGAIELWKVLKQANLIGIFLLTAGIVLFLLPISLQQGDVRKYARAQVIVPTVLGFVVIVLFICWEARFAKNRIMPRGVISRRTIPAVMASNIFQYMSFEMLNVYFYTYLMVCGELSVSNATYVSLTLMACTQIMGFAYGSLIVRFKHVKWIYVAGMAIGVLGRGLQYRFNDPNKNIAGLVVSQIVCGIGFGVNIHALTIGQAATSTEDYPELIATYFISSNVGASIGGSIVGAVWPSVLSEKLRAALPSELAEQVPIIMNSLDAAKSFPLESVEGQAIKTSFESTYKIVVLIGTVAVALALVASLAVKDIQMLEAEGEEQHARS